MAQVLVRDDGAGISRAATPLGRASAIALIAMIADQVEHRLPSHGAGFELWMCFRPRSSEKVMGALELADLVDELPFIVPS